MKDWFVAQEYELRFAIEFMQTSFYKTLFNDMIAGNQKVSEGYTSDLILKEFFNGSKEEWQKFVTHITNKNCLDIGPSVFTPLSTWDVAKNRYTIEPMFAQLNEWQVNNLGNSAFKDMTMNYGYNAEELIPDLVNKINGAIYCRNMLDHTPDWISVLSNIKQYAKKGCKLLLWSDLDHKGTANEGHYDITTDIPSFKELIKGFKFNIIREYQDKARDFINWGCYAEKI
jgi:hypothetical protein